MAVGLPRVALASYKALSSSWMSWPSTTTVYHLKFNQLVIDWLITGNDLAKHDPDIFQKTPNFFERQEVIHILSPPKGYVYIFIIQC